MSVVIKGSSNVNLDFTTGGRITGDFSNTTLANRVYFQNTTTAQTSLGVLPGPGFAIAAVNIFSQEDPANSGLLQFRIENGVDARLSSAITGTGSYLPMTFFTGGSERVRIDTSGRFMVGTTSAGIGNNIGTTIEASGLNNARITVNHSSAGSSNDSNFMQFGYGGTLTGRIVQSSVSGVSYVTSSDYRLKEDVQPMMGALTKVAALKPVTYKWKVDGSDGQGFIAHELSEVVPDCVSGEKDAVDAEGNPQYQGIDTSFLVATLTAAIQELKAMNDTLTARVAQLEAK